MDHPINTWIKERDGYRFRVDTFYDDRYDAPWERSDGHGPVSEWRGKNTKTPGEIVLVDSHRECRFYDFADATRIAKRDGWGLGDAELAKLERRLGRKPTRNEIIKEAVERDYEFLRSWCNDEWCYVGVVVTPMGEDDELEDVQPDYSYAVWGVESNEPEYVEECAGDLINEIINEKKSETKEAAFWANMDLATVGGA